jgi:hypothetical protein
MQRIAALLVVWLAGCTAIDGHQQVRGWPKLEVVEHYVPHHVMRDRCVRYTGFGMSPEACAEFNLLENRCDIWYSADFPPQRFIVEHERLHCAGYDHYGSTAMQQLLDYHVARLGESAAAGR